ncbi:MAG: toluene hydroxylase [Sporichthyaceae bacterium]
MAASKRRTWSAFGDIKRRPSEYEIVTHKLHYSMRPGREAPYEASPAAPMNLWFSTYRDDSPFQCEDWDGFRDPDQYTYREYCARQDEKEVVVRELCSDFHDRGHDAQLNPEWVAVLRQAFTPARYPLHGLQLMAAYVGQIAPSSYITNASCFEAADYVRAVCVYAYRTRELQMAHPKLGFVDGEQETWQSDKAWQPVRKLVEEALVAYDWSESFAALNLVFRPTLDSVWYKTFAAVATKNSDELTSLLLTNLADDTERAARWSAALCQYAIKQNPANAAVLQGWVDKWAPAADEAAKSVAGMLVPAGGDAKKALAAARGARAKMLESCGVTAGKK